jgi:hypothetical protein
MPGPRATMAGAASAAKAPSALIPPGGSAAAALTPTDANVAALAVRLADAAASLGKHVILLSEAAGTIASVMTETHRLVGVVAGLAGDYSAMHTTQLRGEPKQGRAGRGPDTPQSRSQARRRRTPRSAQHSPPKELGAPRRGKGLRGAKAPALLGPGSSAPAARAPPAGGKIKRAEAPPPPPAIPSPGHQDLRRLSDGLCRRRTARSRNHVQSRRTRSGYAGDTASQGRREKERFPKPVRDQGTLSREYTPADQPCSPFLNSHPSRHAPLTSDCPQQALSPHQI